MSRLAQVLALLAAASVATVCVPAAAIANSSLDATRAVSGEGEAAHFDRSGRILFIGAPPTGEASPVVTSNITVSRTSDLVGRELRLIWRPRPHLASPGFGDGTLPTGLPLASYAMTSGFGMREHPLLGGWREHTGVDLAAPLGSPIVATSNGTVGQADWRGGYGLFVALEHGEGIETRYGHMSRLNVVAGEQVHKGQVIGYVGSTGRSTGPHLHYEVRRNGQAINPASLLRR